MSLLHVFLLHIVCIPVALALQPGDRVPAAYQTLQGEGRTKWVELDLPRLPRFQRDESCHAVLQFPEAFKPSEDAKIRLSFADSKLSVPWTYLYSARDVGGLEKLVITFVHDEYDVLQLDFKPYYGTNLDIISKGFYPPVEIEYRWESVRDDDVASAMQALFLVTIVLVAYMMRRTCQDLNQRTAATSTAASSASAAAYARPSAYKPLKTNIH